VVGGTIVVAAPTRPAMRTGKWPRAPRARLVRVAVRTLTPVQRKP
jgi:hypothetical protein